MAKRDLKALTARLREHLAKSGLAPPTEVPASTPQTDLISAIEASNIPQGAWIAKVLEIMPKPPSPTRYRVSGTLIGKPGSGKCGISFWLRPSRAGSELLDTVEGKRSHADAVECAAAMIFRHISNDAVYVFPSWARWRTVEALESYLLGMRAREAGRFRTAREHFNDAREREPRNLLARMQLASLSELEARQRRDGRPATRARTTTIQARTLGTYLEAAIERPTLVEARYRTSILSGVLASEVRKLPRVDRALLRQIIGLQNVEADDLADKLQDLAEEESEAVRQMLHAWYVLLRRGRLRNRYEPRGLQRRELKRAVCITDQCLSVRDRVTHWWTGADLWRRRASVRLWHLIPGASRGWQAHYNAGCFYALLHERERDLPGTSVDHARMRGLRRRAYKHLNLASEEGRERLDPQWLETGDPDLDTLRKQNEIEWRLLNRRHRGTRRTTPEIHEFPARAWPYPLR